MSHGNYETLGGTKLTPCPTLPIWRLQPVDGAAMDVAAPVHACATSEATVANTAGSHGEAVDEAVTVPGAMPQADACCDGGQPDEAAVVLLPAPPPEGAVEPRGARHPLQVRFPTGFDATPQALQTHGDSGCCGCGCTSTCRSVCDGDQSASPVEARPAEEPAPQPYGPGDPPLKSHALVAPSAAADGVGSGIASETCIWGSAGWD